MGKYKSGSEREKKDSGSLTVKILIIAVVILVSIDGLTKQHELVVQTPHVVHLPQHEPVKYESLNSASELLQQKKKEKKLKAQVQKTKTRVEGVLPVQEIDFSATGASAILDQEISPEEENSFYPATNVGTDTTSDPAASKKTKKLKKQQPASQIDIGAIRPKCNSSRCRQKAAQLRSKLRRQKREEAALLLFPIKEECHRENVKDLLIQGPTDVVMSGEAWKSGGRLKMPKINPPPGETKSNMTLWLESCPTFKSLYVGTVNSQLIHSGIVPDIDPLKYHIRNKHDSCAIIGNGGGLLLAPLGEQINKHDAVFRFNGGPTFGFEEHVGKKTTYRLDNSQHFLFHEPGTNEIILQHVTNREMFNQVKEEAEIITAAEASDLRVHVIDPMFHYYVMNVNRIGAPSNGFFGIVLSHLICNQITLFGYQKDWRNQSIPYHYYDDVEPILGQWDRDNREKLMLESTLELVNEIAEESPEWVHWKQINGWAYNKVVYAEERYPSLFTSEIPEKYKVYHKVEPGANLPPLDGSPPPGESEGEEGSDEETGQGQAMATGSGDSR